MKKSHPFLSLFILLAGPHVSTFAVAKDLVDLIPGLYGGDGIFLAPPGINPQTGEPFPSHQPHFTIASAATINQLNKQIASEVRPVPITPSAGGITYQFDPVRGTYAQTSDTLGPLVAERPQTLGQGKFSLGFNFTYFEYDEFEGDDLDNLVVIAKHQFDVIPPPDSPQSFEFDTLAIAFDVDLDFKIFALSGTYGVTDRFDVSLVVPIIDVDMDVDALASIVTSPLNPLPPEIHSFEGGPEDPRDSASDSATGIGDVILGAKYYWLNEDRYDLAAAARIKFETGDEDDFLGTGSTTFQPFLIASADLFKATTLHTNVGFEFDSDDSDRHQFVYAVGLDTGNQKWTGAVDVLGRHELDGDGIGENIVDVAAGLKWSPIENLIFSVNFLIPANDEGLRSDLVSTVGLEFRN